MSKAQTFNQLWRDEQYQMLSRLTVAMRGLVSVRRSLNKAGRADGLGEIDEQAKALMNDVKRLAATITEINKSEGVRGDDRLARQIAGFNEALDDYTIARKEKPVKLRKPKPAVERVRLLRERRKRGVRHVVQVEVTDAHLATLVKAGLLTPDEAMDRKSVAEVIEELLSSSEAARGFMKQAQADAEIEDAQKDWSLDNLVA